MAKQVSPGVLALRKVVDDVYADAREAKKQGKLVGWSSSKFPCELAEAFDLNVMYPENQAAGIAAQRDGEIMCQAAEDLGFDNDICGYARISLAYAAGKRASRKFDPETLEFIIDPNSGKPLKDENGKVVIDPETGKPKKDPKTQQPYTVLDDIHIVDATFSGNIQINAAAVATHYVTHESIVEAEVNQNFIAGCGAYVAGPKCFPYSVAGQ